MKDPDVPQSTLRALASLLVLLFDLARERAADVIEKVVPLVEPPRDLVVSSRLGTMYSGIIVLDRGEVIAGIVVATGQTVPQPSALVTPPPSPARSPFAGITDRYSRGEGRLPGWADDPRIDEEESPWRR